MAHVLAKAIHRKYDEFFPCVTELNPITHVWRFKGRVLRKFMHFSSSGETLNFILADSKGDRIHGTVLPGDVAFFSARFAEGDWILFVDFDLLPVEGEFRPTNHPFRMSLRRNTVCVDVSSINVDNVFSFIDLEKILSGETDTSCCVDLIGKVVNVGNFCDRVSSLGMSRRKIIRFFLEDSRGFQLSCYLTGHYAGDFIRSLEHCGEGSIVCVIRFARIIVRKGIFVATTAYDCTQVLLNPPASVIGAFQGS